jgi:(1->4)-alpha-D-glucan 1-alpha-D-glucosylmutase
MRMQPLALHAAGLVDGLRVDHVDGLADPRAYCRRLHARLAAQRDERPFLVVEKILAPGETLPDDWHADGTTGYDFMNDVAALLHDRPAPSRSPALGRRVGRRAPSPTRRSPVAAAPRQLAGEHARLARALHRIARAAPATRDISRNALHRVLGELAVHLPVYRMYPALGDEPGDADRRVLERAYDAARAATDPSDRCARARRRLARAARHPRAARRSGRAAARRVRAAQRAACREGRRGYGELPLRPAAVAQRGRRRRGRLQPVARRVPRAQPASRAQRAAHARRHRDARSQARRRRACAARGAERSARRVARGVARLVGAEPAASRRRAAISRGRRGRRPRPCCIRRWWAAGRRRSRPTTRRASPRWPSVVGWQTKALREAKQHTDWLAPDADYERASEQFVRAILTPRGAGDFLHRRMRRRADRPAGVVNSLAQVALRIASPGVPDLYQGTELWDHSLVDPDNRREVPAQLAAEPVDRPVAAYLRDWPDVAREARADRDARRCAHRRRRSRTARTCRCACAAARRHAVASRRDDTATVVVVRLACRLLGDMPALRASSLEWGDTAVAAAGGGRAVARLPERRRRGRDA